MDEDDCDSSVELNAGNMKNTGIFIERCITHPQYYGQTKERRMRKSIIKYACRGDYERMTEEYNRETHLSSKWRPMQPIEAAHRCFVLEDVCRFLKNEGYQVLPKTAIPRLQTPETTELELEEEVKNAELVCHQEEEDIRRVEKGRRRNPFVKLVLREEAMLRRMRRTCKTDNVMITTSAMKVFLRTIIEWIRRVVQDAIIIDGQFKVKKRASPCLLMESVKVALRWNGLEESVVDEIMRKGDGSKHDLMDVDGDDTRIKRPRMSSTNDDPESEPDTDTDTDTDTGTGTGTDLGSTTPSQSKAPSVANSMDSAFLLFNSNSDSDSSLDHYWTEVDNAGFHPQEEESDESIDDEDDFIVNEDYFEDKDDLEIPGTPQ